MKTMAVITTCLLMVVVISAQLPPKEGYIPDPETAVRVAEAVLIPVYGENQITSERPFHAVLKDDVWTVDGTVHCKDSKGNDSQYCKGGAAQVKISKTDGRILNMIHYK